MKACFQVRFGDLPFAEGSLKRLLLLENHIAEPFRLSGHLSKESLHCLKLFRSEMQLPGVDGVKDVAWTRVTVQLCGPRQPHPQPFAEIVDLLLGEPPDL